MLFATPPPIQLKRGKQIGWGTANNKTNWTNYYDGQIRNTEQQSDPIYYTLFCRCTTLLRLLPPSSQTVYFCWAKLVCFDFSSSNFTMQDHVLSTAGERCCFFFSCSYNVFRVLIAGSTKVLSASFFSWLPVCPSKMCLEMPRYILVLLL